MSGVFSNEKIRFVCVGAFNTGLDFIMFNFWTFAVGLKPVLANTLSVVVGITISYILNHRFVFHSEQAPSLKKYLMFFGVSGVSAIALQNLIIWGVSAFFRMDFTNSLFLLNEIGHNHGIELNIAKALAVGVGMIWNFMFYKYIIFKKKQQVTMLEIEEEVYE